MVVNNGGLAEYFMQPLAPETLSVLKKVAESTAFPLKMSLDTKFFYLTPSHHEVMIRNVALSNFTVVNYLRVHFKSYLPLFGKKRRKKHHARKGL